MGGRGASAGLNKNSVLDSSAKVRTIEARYIEARGMFSRGRYTDEVLEAVKGNEAGELAFVYAKPDTREKTAKTNKTNYLTYNLKSGAENGEVFGVKWENVKSVSGQTYNLRDDLKKRGFKWDGKSKKWVLPQ
jgi:hypothetical protein